MYYNTSDGFNEELSLAVSADGLFWRREGSLPVLLYSGGVNDSAEGIGCASSSDGLHWTKFPGNPIFSIFQGVAWRTARTHNPWVLFDPLQFSGHGDRVCFKLWLTGAPAGDPNDVDVGYATE